MWCPKCGNEYKEGIVICPECNIDLVNELKEEKEKTVEIAVIEKEYEQKVLAYLTYLDIYFETEESEVVYDNPITGETESKPGVKIFVKKNERKKAVEEIRTVIMVEAENKINEMMENNNISGGTSDESEEDSENKENTIPLRTPEYVKAKSKFDDFKSSSIMFAIMGVLLIAFSLLNIFKILHLVENRYSQIVLISLGIGCFLIAFSSKKRADQLKDDVEKENAEEDRLKKFLALNFPKQTLDAMCDDETPIELQYIKQADAMKEAMMNQYPDTEPDHADILIEEYYNTLYGTEEAEVTEE